ncbi:cytochrome-c peroxidase [Flavisolibacter nicotianae]|uniref:cytochrome-c peroxidase n=1 Tax=Flavisolibacter nicotianae TaxID=2364882 RepID=UPI000EB4F833|nr:cytochrome c peroxidase [Flavisolibacter nicotianae]
MQNKKIPLILFLIISSMVILAACSKDKDVITVVPIDKVQLGRQLFFDKNLSNPIGQSCASCHSPEAAFSDPAHSITSQGAVSRLFNNRNCPSVTYSSFAPAFRFDTTDSLYMGGFFFDGRVNSLQEQAKKPFLNQLEMNNTDAAMVVAKLRSADYYPLYKKIYGDATNVEQAFGNLADAIATFEQSSQVNAFSSKFDDYLQGKAQLTEPEKRGFELFNDPLKGNCAACHISDPDPDFGKVLFTDFTYDNIGVPKNPANPFYSIPSAFNPQGTSALDYGLGGVLNDPAYYGHFKVPSLRNAALTAPYFHNGFFTTLEEVVHFYNKRDVESFPTAEFPATVNHQEMGNLHLTTQEEKDIVAFLKTLSDGYK